MAITNFRRRSSRGFSLIELGIVIAVIAVLAAVVVFGRGFILAARVTKAVDASNTIRKAASAFAGVNGGAVPNSNTNELPALANRSLVPIQPNSTAWPVTTGVNLTDVRFGQLTGANNVLPGNGVAMTFQMDAATMVEDLLNAVRTDRNFVNATPMLGNLACQNAATATSITLCFSL